MHTDKTIIIPVYLKTKKLLNITLKCLKSLRETYKGEIIIISDGNTGIQTDIHKYMPVTIINRHSNGGYACAINDGLGCARGDVLIICNNDIEFIQPDWLDHLLKPLEDYDISSIRTTDADGWETEDRIEEDAKFGSLWAMKRTVYDTIGPLDETFGKGYFEDLDYHERAKRAGFRIAKNHAGLVEHIGKATFKQVDPSDTAYRTAMERFKEKYGKVW